MTCKVLILILIVHTRHEYVQQTSRKSKAGYEVRCTYRKIRN